MHQDNHRAQTDELRLQDKVEGLVFSRLRAVYAEISQGEPDNTKLDELAKHVAQELLKMRRNNE